MGENESYCCVSIQALQENLPDLITFNPSSVDQDAGERVSDTELTDIADGHTEVEVSLLYVIYFITLEP